MNIQITSVNMRYADGAVSSVQVHFSGNNDDRTININGYIPLTADEYKGNEAPAALEGIVRQQVSEKIMNTPSAE